MKTKRLYKMLDLNIDFIFDTSGTGKIISHK